MGGSTQGDPAPDLAEFSHRVVFRDPHGYVAHPHMVVTAAGTWLAVFNRAPRRSVVLHPPQDPEFRNLMIRSDDEGRTWSAPEVVPSYAFSGVECAGLTALRDGRVLLNQWQFGWLPKGAVPAGSGDWVCSDQLMAGLVSSSELDVFAAAPAGDLAARFPWARGPGRALVHVSDDDGRSFRRGAPVATAPFSGGYGMRGAVELADGTLVLPLSDVPNYRAVFVIRSADRGETWSAPILAAAGEGHEFEEPAGLVLSGGRVLLMLRDNLSRVLHAVISEDGGLTWSTPRPTRIADYPPHLLRLEDGRIACVAGRRVPPYGIRLYLSADESLSWDIDGARWVRKDLPSKDVGYPAMAQRGNSDLVVVYYARDREGITGLHQSVVPEARIGAG